MANMTKPATVLDTDTSWTKVPYGVILGKSFATYRETVLDVLAKGFKEADTTLTDAAALSKAETELKAIEKNDKTITGKPSVTDASVGGNDAINPYPAFGLDDDIVPLMHSGAGTRGRYGYTGMGRVYSEVFDGQQRILWLTMGVPHYNDLETYLGKATAAKLAVTHENGYISAAYRFGHLLGSGLKLAIELPWLPLIWGTKLLNMGNTFDVSDYVKFYQTMPLYYRMVNEIMSRLAVNMGMWGNASSQGLNDTATATKYRDNLPEIMKNGPDIFQIMNKRARRLEPNNAIANMSTDDLTDHQADAMGEGIVKDEKTGKPVIKGGKFTELFDQFTGAFKGTALGGSDFIGFRIEKSVDASESFSNSTKESQLASDLNGFIGQKRDIAINNAGGNGVMGTIGAAVQGFEQFMGAWSTSKRAGVLNIYCGNGYFDLPEVWSNSSFSKSYNFKLTLRAKYGDPASIYQSIYIPLACLLAAALPRGTGSSSYTSPFMVRAYVKGMFAIPYGIIDNLSITRGDQEFGWNYSNMPTVVNVNFSIRDLSPVLFMNISDTDVMEPMRANTKLNMYLDTLAGIGLKERYFRWDTMTRRAQAVLLMKRNTWLSGTYWATVMGDSAPVKTFAGLIPYDRVSRK